MVTQRLYLQGLIPPFYDLNIFSYLQPYLFKNYLFQMGRNKEWNKRKRGERDWVIGGCEKERQTKLSLAEHNSSAGDRLKWSQDTSSQFMSPMWRKRFHGPFSKMMLLSSYSNTGWNCHRWQLIPTPNAHLCNALLSQLIFIHVPITDHEEMKFCTFWKITKIPKIVDITL